jgi:group II intron reverse transcriptase/maturase
MSANDKQALKTGLAEAPARVLAAQLDFAAAWKRVEEKAGMPGVDGVSVRAFARAATANLRALSACLASQTYRPDPLRMAEAEKKSGARRLLLIPTVKDRVAQSAAAQWLGAKWNPSFDQASFAYRPGLGVRDALRALAALRDRGYHWVLDADIRTFFDSIDHELLLEKLALWLGASSPLLDWIRAWAAAVVWTGTELRCLPRGVPQGSPLSPLLANFYLDEFDRCLRQAGIPLVRYADDFLVLARTPFDLDEARRVVETALRKLGLELSPEKTRATRFEQWFQFLGADIQGDRILLPFDKKKPCKRPVAVAPVMPRALLSSYHAGHLKPVGPLERAAHTVETAPHPAVRPQCEPLAALAAMPLRAVLEALRTGGSL